MKINKTLYRMFFFRLYRIFSFHIFIMLPIVFLAGCYSTTLPVEHKPEHRPKSLWSAKVDFNISSGRISAGLRLLDINSSREDSKPKEKIHEIERALDSYEEVLLCFEKSLKDNENYTLYKKQLSENDYQMYLSEIEKYRPQVIEARREYEMIKERYTLEIVALNTEQKKFDVRIASYRELIEKIITLRGIPKTNVIAREEGIFYVKNVRTENRHLIIDAYRAEFPKCRFGFKKIYASVNGLNLGQVEEIAPKIRSWELSKNNNGRNTLYQYRFDLKDLNIETPSAGDVVNISVVGYDWNETIKVTIKSNDIVHQDESSHTTILLQGKRVENHIFLPLTAKIGSVEIKQDCLLDTGASLTTVCFTGDRDIDSQRSVSFSTANGVINLPVINSAVNVGNLRRVIDIALSKSVDLNLLGANFFEGYLYTIDIENASIYLVKK